MIHSEPFIRLFFFRYPQTTKLYFKRSLPYVYWARGNFKGALQAFVDLHKGPSATGIYSNKPVIYVTWLLTTFPELSVIVKILCYAKSCLTDKTEIGMFVTLLLKVVQNIWHFISYIFFFAILIFYMNVVRQVNNQKPQKHQIFQTIKVYCFSCCLYSILKMFDV